MVRIPDPGRLELRLADGAANPYLLPAAILAAGLEGLRIGRDPGPRLDIDMYAECGARPEVPRLPANLLDALRALAADPTLAGGGFAATTAAFVRLKTAEWEDYARHLTRWEIEATLDC